MVGDRERQKTNDDRQNGTLSDRENTTVAKNGKNPNSSANMPQIRHQRIDKVCPQAQSLWAYREALS